MRITAERVTMVITLFNPSIKTLNYHHTPRQIYERDWLGKQNVFIDNVPLREETPKPGKKGGYCKCRSVVVMELRILNFSSGDIVR